MIYEPGPCHAPYLSAESLGGEILGVAAGYGYDGLIWRRNGL